MQPRGHEWQGIEQTGRQRRKFWSEKKKVCLKSEPLFQVTHRIRVGFRSVVYLCDTSEKLLVLIQAIEG